MADYEIQGLREFIAAIKRNPRYTIDRGNVFIVRGLAEYRRAINRNPWRIGMSGGGAPVATGNLRDTHQTTVGPLSGSIYPTAPYAKYVHGLPGYPRRSKRPLRPWLNYATEAAKPQIEQHERELLNDIVKALAS